MPTPEAIERANKIAAYCLESGMNIVGDSWKESKMINYPIFVDRIATALDSVRKEERKRCAEIAKNYFKPHTLASENSDIYIEQWELGKRISKAIEDTTK